MRAAGPLSRETTAAGRQTGSDTSNEGFRPLNRPTSLGGPDWLSHTIHVSGPSARVEAFRTQACGAAAIPWELDLDAEEQRLLLPMIAEGPDARILARQLRGAVAAHHARVMAQCARGGVCPLDLHRLVPVPPHILRLGPDDPASETWLRAHWGTTWPLRRVELVTGKFDRRLRRSARLTYRFLSADWTPWQAVRRLRADWTGLVVDVRPHYELG